MVIINFLYVALIVYKVCMIVHAEYAVGHDEFTHANAILMA